MHSIHLKQLKMSHQSTSTPHVGDQGTSTSAFVQPSATLNLDPTEDKVLEHYQDIQLPSCAVTRQQGSFIRNLTHPDEIRKRCLAAKRAGKGRKKTGQVDNGGAATSTRRSKRKVEDRYDVFDHLAALHRKRRSQMESDSQEVPVSPQIDFLLPTDSPSFHSTWQPAGLGREVETQARRALFASELSGHGPVGFRKEDELGSNHPASLDGQVGAKAWRALFASELSGHGPVGFRKEDEHHPASLDGLVAKARRTLLASELSGQVFREEDELGHGAVGFKEEDELGHGTVGFREEDKLGHDFRKEDELGLSFPPPPHVSEEAEEEEGGREGPVAATTLHASFSVPCLAGDQTLEHERPFQVAQVPTLDSNPILRAQVSSPASLLARNPFTPFRTRTSSSNLPFHVSGACDPELFDARNFSILNYYPREE